MNPRIKSSGERVSLGEFRELCSKRPTPVEFIYDVNNQRSGKPLYAKAVCKYSRVAVMLPGMICFMGDGNSLYFWGVRYIRIHKAARDQQWRTFDIVCDDHNGGHVEAYTMIADLS